MEATMLFLIWMFGLIAFGGASIIWGADSRDQYPDDHTR
jgi:hypothetical protein